MFNKIVIKNIFGINNEISIDFMATPKKKDKKDTVVEIEQNVSVDKVIGIIGPNASGKSSIINALLELRCFLAQYDLVERAKIREDDGMIKFIANRLNHIRNLKNHGEDSEIELETYIPSGEVPGYYNYYLKFNDERLVEKLIYRKKYKSQKKIIIEDYTTDKRRSDIGYKCFYKDSILKDYEDVGKTLANKFRETLKYYETFYNYYVGNSIYQIGLNDIDYINFKDTIEYIKYNENIINQLLKIVDPKIKGICIEKDDTGEEVIRFKLSNNVKLDIWDISTGTKRILNIFILMMHTKENNGIMLCDEIETAFHKEIVQLIIQIYIKNNEYSQLLFTTHNPEILDNGMMRNEQKYFLSCKGEKVLLRKVSEINPRADYNFSKNYYKDLEFLPQPTKEDIDKFCEFIAREFNKGQG